MKKAISLILVLVLCVAMCACGKSDAVVDPLLGKWEVKSTDFEGSFEFLAEEDGTIVGTWTYFDYAQDKWGDFDFTVKEKTDSTITLLIEDGTMDTLHYTFYANHLYLEGVLYTNAALQDVTVTENTDGRIMLLDGRPLQLYNGIFLGMHAEDVILAMGQNLEITATGRAGNPHYRYSFACDYEAECQVDGEYYHVDFGFDENLRLVNLHLQGRYGIGTVSAKIDSITVLCGQGYTLKTESDDAYNRDYYCWEYGDFSIELTAATDIINPTTGYYTVAYYYNPKSS